MIIDPPSEVLPRSMDILIVGMGLSGIAFASRLPPGARALIIDRTRDVGMRPCGGVMVEDVWRNLGPGQISALPFVRPARLKARLINCDTGITSLQPERIYFNIDKSAWLREAASRCPDSVVRSFCTTLTGLETTRNGVRCLLRVGRGKIVKSHIVETKWLVGADGARSSVRSLLRMPRVPLVYAMQGTVRNRNESDCFDFIIDSRHTEFYGWRIPKNDCIIIGMASRNPRCLFSRLKALISLLGPERADCFLACTLARPSGPEVVMWGRGRILLTGEAAGLCSPLSGEGISYALDSSATAEALLSMDAGKAAAFHQSVVKEQAKRIADAAAAATAVFGC